ncbi:hypothetical protein BG011_002401 [Mortierella polycephala]|uniref:Phospholipase n=1 Tax=Mortierella polycephala TaxID=41804 RepID=A0A9P6Q3C4_9FUNG|nr:hypothetical protein BG011_002401 [Mortierella polycephala]
MSQSTHSADSARPLNLINLLSAEQQKLKHADSEDLAELDSAPVSYTTDATDETQEQDLDCDPDQPQKPLDLASFVDRVRLAQKHDPSSLLTPVEETPPTLHTPVTQPDQPEERQHWYSSIIPRRYRDASESSTAPLTPPQQESTPPPPPPPKPVTPPKELTAIDHVANAFASSSRADNLESIDFTVESLAVTGVTAPAFMLRTDEKGRRPPPVLFQMLKLAIVDSEVNLDASRQIIFRIELQYGDIKWVIRRTLYEFYKLHLTLSAKVYDNMPRFPNQVSWALSMAKAGLGITSDDQDTYVRETNLARRKSLQSYLLKVLAALNSVVVYDLYEFLEISALSLTKDMGWKGKEGYVIMKVVDSSKTFCGIPIGFDDYDRRWAILRDSYISFARDSSSEECKDVIIFDQNFYVHDKENVLGFHQHHIEIGNGHRKVEIKGERSQDMLEWVSHIEKMQQASPWVKSHRFGSFAPEREDTKTRYYVDGKDYFHAISDAILAAKDEIYIADWWLSPQLYLRRPPEDNEEFRLDRMLKKKAEEGIMIYIVVYKEITLALTLDSSHTKTWLQDLHPNIQVQRHPDHIGVNATQFWAHHEKICVIDCRLAFIGGLDLCFGRYDSKTHQLSDYHPSGTGTIWPGQDYSNPRIKDFANVKDYNTDLIERKLLGRMPWHDVSIGVAGQAARDIARHFVQRWNFVKREKGMKKAHMKFLTPKGEFVSTRNESGWTGTQKVQILRSSTVWSQGVDMERSIQDAYLSCIENAEHFIYIENQFFVTSATEDGSDILKNTIGLALVNRIMRAHEEGKKFRVIVVMPLMPAFEADVMSSEAGTLRKVMHFQYISICRGGNSILERLVANDIDPDQYIGFYGLRSFDRIKHGKFDAIVEAVKDAEEESKIMKAREKEEKKRLKKEKEHQKQQQSEEAATAEAELRAQARALKGKGLDVEDNDDIIKSKSLARKFLLDPLPKRKEAERIKAILDKRRIDDKLKTWDESITKRAMNASKKEHGYIPARTERSLANRRHNRHIREGTDRVEAKAKKNRHSGGTTEGSEPHVVEGLDTESPSAMNTLKGTDDQDDLESTHQPTEVERDMAEIGSIVEPVPGANAECAESAESVEGETASNKSSDDDEETETVVDNEVDDFVTEQLYIHSKLMIVDDRIVIIGSANINDRSQVGYRDSEIAIVVEDQQTVPSRMDGVPYQAGKMAHKLRTDLFREHLGLLPHVEHDVVTKGSVLPVDLDAPSQDPDQVRKELVRAAYEQQHQVGSNNHVLYGSQGHLQVTGAPGDEESEILKRWHATCAQAQAKQDSALNPKASKEIVMDPLHDDFYESWWKRVAKTNTEIFREVFHCVPDDTVETWDDYKAFVPDPKKVLTGHVAMPGATVENVTEKLQQVTGHLVEFPTKFLCQENLIGSAVEGAVTPMEIFT